MASVASVSPASLFVTDVLECRGVKKTPSPRRRDDSAHSVHVRGTDVAALLRLHGVHGTTFVDSRLQPEPETACDSTADP
ncbi:hypothetical protein JOB18_017724 [Solea senegalensis]|uniref:Uncharacterized protein n=1 Tax=Solea senegalensis TaxID=28829 RepID=A0AAV6PE29_SOLSE|nr:hypothetical protein JOB18_017724 [Solea senegalensis]